MRLLKLLSAKENMTADSFINATSDAARATLQAYLDTLPINASDVLILGLVSPSLADCVVRSASSTPQARRFALVEPDQEGSRTQGNLRDAGQETFNLIGASFDDLRTDATMVAEMLKDTVPHDTASYYAIRDSINTATIAQPLIADDSFDTVILDLTLNRLTQAGAEQCLAETFRVLKRGGRLLLTAILADLTVSSEFLTKPAWPQLLAWFPTESTVSAMLENAGFYGTSYLWSSSTTWELSETTELRYFILDVFKGKQGPCMDQGHAVIFKGPWKEAVDDDGHRYARGERTAVCEKTFQILTRDPYREFFIGLPCRAAPSLADAPSFDCTTPRLRDPLVTRGIVPVIRIVPERISDAIDPPLGPEPWIAGNLETAKLAQTS
jgi:SAM-dependent methyltransferase